MFEILFPIGILFICVFIIVYQTIEIKKRQKELNGLNIATKQKEDYLRNIEKRKEILEKKEKELLKSISEYEKDKQVAMQSAAEAQSAANMIRTSETERVRAQIDAERKLQKERLSIELEAKRQELELLYTKRLNELETYYKEKKETIESELIDKQAELEEFQKIQESVNEAIRRNKELKEKSDFYSIQVLDSDKEDISLLQSMDLRLHHRDVIPKIIWELFIRRPLQEMEKRVIGTSKRSGIYKITNKETGEAYIGKSTDIATRWQNHLRTTVGLEGAAHSTLHTRLAQDGLWNYTFEILEDVDKDHLSEREAFYIDLYGTKSQLNMKEGSK